MIIYVEATCNVAEPLLYIYIYELTLRMVPRRGSMTRRALSLQTVQIMLPSLFQLTL